MTWSFQLYSSRNQAPWPEVFKGLAEAGYSDVEGFGGLYEDPEALAAALKENRLSMPSGHFPLDLLENDFPKATGIARILGIKLLVCPFVKPESRPGNVGGWQAFGKRLEKIAQTAKAAGFEFAWHNHDFEFKLLPDGSAPMRHILESAPGVGWEIDVAWVIRSGTDPVAWIKAYGDRIVAVHVKDIAEPGMNLDEDGWADVGHGVVDWKGLYGMLRKTAARHYVVEHDKPADAARFARRSIASANKL
jgi:sugar phosphate isomerase/epimerase